MEGKFKTVDKTETENDSQRPKFNLVCIGNIEDNKTRVVLSEKAQPDQKWSTIT